MPSNQALPCMWYGEFCPPIISGREEMFAIDQDVTYRLNLVRELIAQGNSRSLLEKRSSDSTDQRTRLASRQRA